MQSLVKKYTKHTLTDIKGPVTVVTGKQRRVTFFECPNDLNAMIDLAKVRFRILHVPCAVGGLDYSYPSLMVSFQKLLRLRVASLHVSFHSTHVRKGLLGLSVQIADLVMLTIDGSFGFEMETFEFLNILQIQYVSLSCGVRPIDGGIYAVAFLK